MKWDAVYLDGDFPYLAVRRAWHTENNRPVILDELKTKAAERNIPLPTCLAECLKEAKANSTSEYVVANRDGEPLSYTQFKRLWQYIVTRTAKPRMARKLGGRKICEVYALPGAWRKGPKQRPCGLQLGLRGYTASAAAHLHHESYSFIGRPQNGSISGRP